MRFRMRRASERWRAGPSGGEAGHKLFRRELMAQTDNFRTPLPEAVFIWKGRPRATKARRARPATDVAAIERRRLGQQGDVEAFRAARSNGVAMTRSPNPTIPR